MFATPGKIRKESLIRTEIEVHGSNLLDSNSSQQSIEDFAKKQETGSV